MAGEPGGEGGGQAAAAHTVKSPEPVVTAVAGDAAKEAHNPADTTSKDDAAGKDDKDQATADTTPADETDDAKKAKEAKDKADEEARAKAEVVKLLGRAELDTVGEQILSEAIASYRAEAAGKDTKQVDSLTTGNPGKKALQLLEWVDQEKPKMVTLGQSENTTPHHIKHPDGIGRTAIIKSVVDRDGDNFKCIIRVDGLTGDTTVDIPKDVFMTSAVIEHADAIRATLPEKQQKAFDLYVISLKANSSDRTLENIKPDELNTVLTEALGSTSAITGELGATFLMREAERAAAAEPDEAKKNQLLAKAEQTIVDLKLRETLILDGSQLAKIFIRSGVINKEEIGKIIEYPKGQLERIETELKNKDLTPEERKDLEHERSKYRLEEHALRKVPDVLDETVLAEVLENINSGKVAPKFLAKLHSAMETGNTDAMLDIALGYDEPSDDEIKKKSQLDHRNELKKRLGKAGGLDCFSYGDHDVYGDEGWK